MPEREPQQQRDSGVQHHENGHQPESSEMQAEDQMLSEELFPAPLQDRKQRRIQHHHDQNQRSGLHVHQVIKRSGELGKTDAFGCDSGLDQPGGQAAIGHHVQLNTERCAQPAPSKIRLDDKINQVRDKEELKGMQVRFATAA